VVQTFFVDEKIQDKYYLDAIVTVVDGKHIVQHIYEDGVENECVKQVAFAGIILLNKTDLVSGQDLEQVKTKIKSHRGFASNPSINQQLVD